MNSIQWTFQLRFITALALGLLIGLERESSKTISKSLILGGIRTFPIISMFGFGCAWLYQLGSVFMLPAGIICLVVIAAISYLAKIKTDRFGATSEISALLMFVTGALALLADIWICMAIGIINTILLSEKTQLESYVEKLNRSEFTAVLKFLLITLIILPVLPDQNYTRFDLNPAKIWWIVILVSSLGFAGYLLSKYLGDKIGLWLSGLIGGIISSTAVCVANGRLARNDPEMTDSALSSSIVACSVMYIRIFILIFILNPVIGYSMWWKFLTLCLVGFGISLFNKKPVVNKESVKPDVHGLKNPFELKPALLFAVLFVLLSIITQIVKNYSGTNGLMTLSAVVGLTDIDPFILSIIHSVNIDFHLITSAIIIAMMSNTIIKGIYFGSLVPLARYKTIRDFGILALMHIPLLFI
jgi:uncharacterized membrane protein (DUF4010 family)